MKTSLSEKICDLTDWDICFLMYDKITDPLKKRMPLHLHVLTVRAIENPIGDILVQISPYAIDTLKKELQYEYP